MGLLPWGFSFRTARYSRMRFFTFSRPSVVLVRAPAARARCSIWLSLSTDRRIDEPVEIRADHAVLGGGLGHPSSLASSSLPRARHREASGPFAMASARPSPPRTRVSLSRALLQWSHLLGEVVVALRLLHRALRPAGLSRGKAKHLEAMGQLLRDGLHTFAEIEGLRICSVLLDAQVHVRRQHVGEDDGDSTP